jgi:hypothetical protein
MEITVHSTNQITEVNGQPARVWEGKTSKGTKIFCLIHTIGVPVGEDQDEFAKELQAVDILVPTMDVPKEVNLKVP